MFKLFETEEDIKEYIIQDDNIITLSEDSVCANGVHFLTGIRSLGKIESLYDNNDEEELNFELKYKKEIRYKFDFTAIPLLGQSLSADLITGVYSSSADQIFENQTNNIIKQQSIFDYIQGYLYREDKNYDVSSTALKSSSTGVDVSVLRLLNLRKELIFDEIKKTTFAIEFNRGIATLTGYTSGPSALLDFSTSNVTGFTSAIDIKNPYYGNENISNRSFFAIPMDMDPYKGLDNIDNIVDGITIEAIIRPYNNNSVIFFRRLANETDQKTKDKFIKLELTRSPDNTKNAFRFYIRNTATYPNNTDVFSNRVESIITDTFSESNIQASGLFVPADVGINIFDGSFHHIVVSWSVDELGEGVGDNVELGSGVVMGYIDGYKLTNREQVFPRLRGADQSNGPIIQANMLDQRIPVRQNRLRSTDPADAPKNNNIYIGVSNYNREDGDITGDKGNIISNDDIFLDGLYDGQIQELRVWNQRLKDGTTSVKHNSGIRIIKPSADQAAASASLGLSYVNFYDSSLTSTSASNIAAWWRFNNLSSTTAVDIAGGLSGDETAMGDDPFGNLSSLTGYCVGNSSMKLYDHKDILLGTSGNIFTDESASGILRTFLYYDQPDIVSPINNTLSQGRLVRKTIENSVKRTGTVFYNSGQIVIDNADKNTTVDFTWPTSGNIFGFAVSADDETAFNIERIKYNYVENKARLLLNAIGEGDEFNYSENITSLSKETKESIFEKPTTFINQIGLYNNNNDLVAVAKLSRNIKKDENIRTSIQVKLDF